MPCVSVCLHVRVWGGGGCVRVPVCTLVCVCVSLCVCVCVCALYILTHTHIHCTLACVSAHVHTFGEYCMQIPCQYALYIVAYRFISIPLTFLSERVLYQFTIMYVCVHT